MPSEEMLKKLLDEFVEKESLMKEELQVIKDQIQQLEQRLTGCRDRLSTIGGDRDKVIAMKGHYDDLKLGLAKASGNPFSAGSISPQPTTSVKPQSVAPVQPAALPVTQPAVVQTPVAQAPVSPVVEPVQPVEPVKIPEMAKPIEPVKPVESPKPIEPVKPVESPKPIEPVSFVEPVQHTPISAPVNEPPIFNDGPLIPETKSPGNAAASGISAILGARAQQNNSVPPAPAAAPPVTPEVLPPEPSTDQPASAGRPGDATADSDSKGTIVDLGGSEEPAEESDGETVKSINDALRSLFR